MKIEIGTYVRYTTVGNLQKIAKVINIIPPEFPIWEEYYRLDNADGAIPSVIIKADSKLIKLIEVGDYVNGYKVLAIWHDNMASEGFNDYVEVLNGKVYEVARRIYPNSIKTIVTKQQFESSIYEVKNEN